MLNFMFAYFATIRNIFPLFGGKDAQSLPQMSSDHVHEVSFLCSLPKPTSQGLQWDRQRPARPASTVSRLSKIPENSRVCANTLA